MRRNRALGSSLVLLAPLLTGCGNDVTADVIGMAAVTRGTDGGPVVLVKVCSKDIDRITVYKSRQGLSQDQPNPKVGRWSTDRARTGLVRFQVDRPPSGWSADSTTPDAVVLAPDKTYVVIAERSEEDAEVTQTSFRGSRLTGLRAGQLLVKDSETWTMQRFERHACDSHPG